MAKLKFTNGRRDKGSNIKSASHDPNRNELTVHFNTGRTYTYENVPLEKAQAFENADSKGKFLHAHIVPHHPATEITANNPAPSDRQVDLKSEARSAQPRSKRGRY